MESIVILISLLNKYGIQYVLKFKGTDPYQLFAKLTNMVSMKKILGFKNFEPSYKRYDYIYVVK
jgi:hypothetical protein